MSDFTARLSREREEKQRLTKQILDDQVQELRSRPNELRLDHIKMLEECNSMWDIIPLSKAINYLHDNPPPHFNLNQADATDEEKRFYEENLIPFEVKSDNGVSPYFSSSPPNESTTMMVRMDP